MKQVVFLILSFLSIIQLNASSRYAIILAGGSGERLWPISRKERPKQLLSIDGKKTFLQQAIYRLEDMIPKDNIWICTAQHHAKKIDKCVGVEVGNILVEPAARDTGPAILYSCLQLQAKDENAVVIFLPSDAFIPETENATFAAFVTRAFDFAQKHDHVALFGLQPTYPATGYGYIEFDKNNFKSDHYKITKFHEKPCYERAQNYIARGMLWNQCIFCSKVSVLIDEFKKQAPNMFAKVKACIDGQGSYEDVQKDSIDYAVMEKSDNLWILPVAYSWLDVGNIEVFLSLKNQYSVLHNDIVSFDATNNLVDVKGKLVGLLGVDNLCIVQTDDVLLIAKRDMIEKTRELVGQLKQGENQEYL